MPRLQLKGVNLTPRTDSFDPIETASRDEIGALQLAPVAIAVLTSYLTVSGSGALMALARKARKPAPPGSQAAPQPPRSTS